MSKYLKKLDFFLKFTYMCLSPCVNIKTIFGIFALLHIAYINYIVINIANIGMKFYPEIEMFVFFFPILS